MTNLEITQYEFDPQTNLLIGVVEPDAHPHVGMFLRSTFCTDKVPPTTESGEVAFFDPLLGDWRVIADHRGKVAYDLASGEPRAIHQAGDLPAHLSLDAPVPSLADTLANAKVGALAHLKSAYEAAIQQPVHYLNTEFQADATSQDMLTKVLAAGAIPADFAWLDTHNQPIKMTYVELQGLAGAILVQGQTAFFQWQTHKGKIRAASTVDELAMWSGL